MAVAVGKAADAQSAPTLGSTCMEAPPPLLVQVLGGNVVTTAAVLACLNTIDATVLRRLHPALAVAVAAVPWADKDTQVHDTVRWRAALPAATGLNLALKLAKKAEPVPAVLQDRALAALWGVTVLDLAECDSVTAGVIACLPPTLRALNVSRCWNVTQQVCFMHLPALEWLDCTSTGALATGLSTLPPSLRELRTGMKSCDLPATADFSHLSNLRVMKRTSAHYQLTSTSIASLPPPLEVLDVSSVLTAKAKPWSPEWSVAHLPRLRELNASYTTIDGLPLPSCRHPSTSWFLSTANGCHYQPRLPTSCVCTHLVSTAHPSAATRWPPCRPRSCRSTYVELPKCMQPARC